MSYTKDSIEKIGNTIIFLAKAIPNLSKTKLLKLLYILEELSIKKYHTPFLNLEFEVWQAGPVTKDIFVELSDSPIILSEYIETLNTEYKGNRITEVLAKKEFVDDEFSDNDIELLEEIVRKYKKIPATELVELTHEKDSLWYQVAKENNLLEEFKLKRLSNSDRKIDFNKLLKDSKSKQFYNEQLELIEFSNKLKI